MQLMPLVHPALSGRFRANRHTNRHQAHVNRVLWWLERGPVPHCCLTQQQSVSFCSLRHLLAKVRR